jgi:hypothetical protein
LTPRVNYGLGGVAEVLVGRVEQCGEAGCFGNGVAQAGGGVARAGEIFVGEVRCQLSQGLRQGSGEFGQRHGDRLEVCDGQGGDAWSGLAVEVMDRGRGRVGQLV